MNPLLELVWKQSNGFRCIASNPSGEFRNDFFEDNRSAAAHADLQSRRSFDVWYAPAIFNSARRGKDNVREVCALWLDIDIKPETYRNVTEIENAIRQFLTDSKIPAPILVFSGNGVHCYWITDAPFTSDEWLDNAKALREACIEFNLKADHSVTIDIARILRVPGTKNFKERANPKDVRFLSEIQIVSKADVVAALEPFTLKNKLKAEAKTVNKQFLIEFPQTPKNAELIADACGQMRLMRETRGSLPEPQWYAGLAVLALCENGENLAHEWSKGYSDYKKRETAEKYERAKEFAPTTCARFDAVAPEICRACPHYGKITTPVQLGERVTPVEVQVERIIEDTAVKESLPVPHGYEVGREGVFTVATEENPRKYILGQPLWVSRAMLAEHGGGSEVELVWLTPRGTKRTAVFRKSLLAKDSSFAEWLHDNGISEFYNNSIKSVIAYVIAGISTVLKLYEEEVIYKKFGLHDSGFVVGEDLITPDGKRKPARISSAIKRDKIKSLKSVGAIERWAEATKLFDRAEWWMHRFTILSALASPLFALTNTDGSVLSLAGESSGGKTTAANFGLSAYGSPRGLTIDPKSTLNAFYEHWRQAANLPVVCNEAATIDRYRLSDIIYAAANGHARDALKQNGEFRDAGTWKLVSIFTSNTHLLALPDKILGEAERRRIFELSFDAENVIPLTVGRAAHQTIERSRGEAGRVFLETALPIKDDLAAQIARRVDDIQSGIDSVHRYNIWLVAVVSVAAEIAVRLGLIRFQIDDVIKNAVLKLAENQDQQVSAIARVEELIAQYTNENQANIGAKALNSHAWLNEPKGEAMGRYDVGSNGETVAFYLPITRFKTWAIERNVDVNQIKQFVQANNIETKPQRLAPYVPKPVSCYVINQQQAEVEN